MNKLKMGLNQTWQYIAYDYLELCPRNRCRGNEVQEAVADRIGMNGMMTQQDSDTWHTLSRQQQDDLLNEVFPPKQWFG